MSRPLRVLVADDESRLRELLVRELGRKGHEVEGVGDGEAALARLRERAYDVVILDMKMPRKEGIEVLRELGAFPEHPQVIVMTGFQEVATAVEAMKLGAYDYLTKPTKIEELDVLVRKAAEKGQLLRDNQALRAHAPGAAPFSGILTKSARMHEVLRVVDRVAPTDSSVLVLGESGTGKELVARGIHERSARAARRFVPIPAATNRDLAEAMKSGDFRQDLYYRINTITVTLPPLRERPEDVALLAQHFVEANAAYGANRLGAAALAALEAYAWPGNVRELLHAVERAVILSRGDEIQPDDLPPEVIGTPSASPAVGGVGGVVGVVGAAGSLETMERQHIVATLRRVAGHRGKAAALLAIDPKTLYRKINGYQIGPQEFR